MKKADLELCYLSATEALSKFKSRELSPVALCKALIQRNTEIGEKLNATTYTFFDRALKEARQAEAKYKKSKGARLRPLEGIPISIKDFHSVKGEITTYGSKAFENNRPDNTAPTVERLLKAAVDRVVPSRVIQLSFTLRRTRTTPVESRPRHFEGFEVHTPFLPVVPSSGSRPRC